MKSNSILVVLAGFFAQFICEGVGLGCELFLPYLQKSFSWTNAQVTLVGSAVNGLSFLLGMYDVVYGDQPENLLKACKLLRGVYLVLKRVKTF